MALTFSTLASFNTSTDGTSAATGSVTPAAGAVVLALILNAKGTTPDVPVPGNAWGITTWNSILSGLFNASQRRISAFWGYASSYSAGTCTVNFTNTQIGMAGSFINVTSPNIATPVVQSDSATGTATATSGLALAAFADAINNGALLAVAHNANEAPTATGYTQLHSLNAPGSPVMNLWTGYQVGEDLTVDASWATSAAYGALALEIAMATAAGSVPALEASYRRRRG